MARILIIEDDELLLDLLSKTLQAAGHTVMAAVNGRQGLKAFREEPADLVITDIVMPEQDGVGVAMALRKESPGTPLIAISGGVSRSPLYLDLAKKLGASRVIAKPFPPAKILRAVNELLGDGERA